MMFSKEAEFICFEKVHISQTQNSKKREGKASIHKHSLTGGGSGNIFNAVFPEVS